MRKIILLIWIILLISIPFFINKNIENSDPSYISSDLDIVEYNVVLSVDKTNKVDVTENITVNMNNNSKGISRTIPLWQKDNFTKKIRITNFRAIGEKFEVSNNSIKIGSDKTNVSSLHTYTIKYRYNMGKDYNKDYDNFIFKLFDNYDNTKIDKMNVTINMPKEFDDSIIFYKQKEEVKVPYEIKDNSIFISYDGKLDDSLTIKLTLPNNYFIGCTSNYGFYCLIICILVTIISIVSIISWKKYGKNFDKRSRTIEFYPPDALDAAEIGYIYGEKNIKKLTVALIIELASKGYITIDGNIIKKKKINDLNMSINEQIVYLELFKSSDTIVSDDPNFSSVFEKIRTSLNKTIDKRINDNSSKKTMNKIFVLLFCSIVIYLIAVLYIKDLSPNYVFLYYIAFISIFITGFFSIFMNRHTSYGEIIMAKVKGFRDYLMTAEKNNLECVVEENANYFYDILPYAYVLNVSNKWIKEFNVPVYNIVIDNNFIFE